MSKDQLKNVNIEQCIYTIIASLVALLIIFIPATFGESYGIQPLYKVMPMVGSGAFLENHTIMMTGFVGLIQLDASLISTFTQVLDLLHTAYFLILAANIIFSLLLIITRSEFLRLIFKIVSIFAGLIMLATALSYLVYLAGLAGIFIKGGAIAPENILTIIDGSGILVAIAFIVFGFAMTGRQFKYFDKLY